VFKLTSIAGIKQMNHMLICVNFQRPFGGDEEEMWFWIIFFTPVCDGNDDGQLIRAS